MSERSEFLTNHIQEASEKAANSFKDARTGGFIGLVAGGLAVKFGIDKELLIAISAGIFSGAAFGVAAYDGVMGVVSRAQAETFQTIAELDSAPQVDGSQLLVPHTPQV